MQRIPHRIFVLTASVAAGLVLFVASPGSANPLTCEKQASSGLAACILKVSIAQELCYGTTGATCSPTNSRIVAARNLLSSRVLGNCSDQDVADAGYPVATAQDLLDRLDEACLGEISTVAARSFGGPHAAVLASTDSAGAQCLKRAQREANRLIYYSYLDQRTCVTLDHSGLTCNLTRTLDKLASRVSQTIADIESSCSDLSALIGPDATTFTERAAAQSRCLVALAHPDGGPLPIDCGPRPGISVPPRGVATQIVLDEATFGTRCGDGSPYAFWVRLAPGTNPVENVIIGLEGGGVCLFDADCKSRFAGSPDLFESVSDTMPTEGAFSTSPSNPLANHTMVFLPYCNQDIFAGGGESETFPTSPNGPELTVERYGAVNLTAALSVVRDMVWSELDAEGGAGYRPDRFTVLYGGASAGGFGVQNSYHWPLDELRWVNTTAMPDASLALNPPSGLLPFLFVLKAGPWGFKRFIAPYCQEANCILGSVILTAHSARLGATPHQRILNVSHQFDRVQQGTTFFPADDITWINAARQYYCDMQGTPFVHYFLAPNTTSLHTVTTTDAEYFGRTSDGIPLVDWIADSFLTNPAGTVDAVEEGGLVAAIPGVNPFPCTVD